MHSLTLLNPQRRFLLPADKLRGAVAHDHEAIFNEKGGQRLEGIRSTERIPSNL